jgi:RimJ/RimL family protein N-acetyltransferase
MAAFPAREKDAFMAHWKNRVLTNKTGHKKTIVSDGQVAGNILCWEQDGKWLVGYWIGQEYWGKGIATDALKEFMRTLPTRPLHAYVAKENIGSVRVLEKCGFTPLGHEMSFSKVHGREIEEIFMVCNAKNS